MWLLKKSQNKISSRKQIAIKEVREGILILPGNEYRLAIETSSVNFELKSEQEQDALIDTFQDFLNSLPSSLQILIRIREVDINQYVKGLELLKTSEKEKRYVSQIEDYSSFVKTLVAGNRILSRKFYIIIPFKDEGKTKDFDIVKRQLTLSKDLVTRSLQKLNMKARALTSLETLDLFYSFYNQGQVKTQQLTEQAIKNLL